MMAKLMVLFLLVFLAILSLLSFFNKGSVSVTVWKGITFDEVPIIALIFISAAIGTISMYIISTFRDAKRRIDSWQVQRKHKKEAKMLDTYARGLESYHASRLDEAEGLFSEVLESDGSNQPALLRLGDIAFQKEEFGAAEEYYLRAKESKPKSIEVLLSLHSAAQAQGNWQEAVKYLDSILDADGDNLQILQKKRRILETRNRWEDVIEVQQKVLKCKLTEEEEERENKTLLGYKHELGRQLAEEGTMDRAIKTLKGVIKSDRTFVAAYIALAETYAKNDNVKEEEATLLKGFEETSSMVFLVRLEDHFINKGEPGKIIEIYQKAVQKNQKDLKIQFFLAKLYYRLEMIDYALDTINAIDPASLATPELHALIGSVYDRRSEFEKASDEFKKALNVDKPLLVPYCCSECRYTTSAWSGRCPECSSWNSLVLDINEICKNQKR